MVSSTASLLLDDGNTYFINGNYSSAISSYSKLIQVLECESSTLDVDQRAHLIFKFRAYSHRSEANFQIQNPTEALSDSETALAFYDVLAAIASDEDESAKTSATAVSQTVLLEGEIEACRSRRKRAQSVSVLMTEEKNTNEAGKDTAKVSADKPAPSTTKRATASSTASSTAPAPVPAAPKEVKRGPPTCPKYQYYQSDSFMTISILEKNVSEEQIKVDFSLDKLTVVLEKGGVSFTVICGTLFDAVDVSKCKIKCKDEKVLIKLCKQNKQQWGNLFGAGAKDKTEDKGQNSAEAEKKPSATQKLNKTSSEQLEQSKEKTKEKPKQVRPYASHKDWDAIERDLKKEETNEKPEGEGAMNALFQSIYGNADEDTRRAMIKSFQTSGGTVLSTNWDEVAKTDYEKKREAPKGQEWKNWEGQRLS